MKLACLRSVVMAFTDHTHYMGLDARKICLRGFANNKGADQPAHPDSLNSALVIRLLDTIISRLATGKISTFWLVSVAEETYLNLTLSQNTVDRFSRVAAHIISYICTILNALRVST